MPLNGFWYFSYPSVYVCCLSVCLSVPAYPRGDLINTLPILANVDHDPLMNGNVYTRIYLKYLYILCYIYSTYKCNACSCVYVCVSVCACVREYACMYVCVCARMCARARAREFSKWTIWLIVSVHYEKRTESHKKWTVKINFIISSCLLLLNNCFLGKEITDIPLERIFI